MNVERTPDQTVIINPQVTYNIGDLLDRLGTRLDSGFASINTKLDNKADKSDLAAINARLDEHGREIGRLKDRQREDEAASMAVSAQRDRARDWRRWALEFAVSAAVAGGTIAAVLH